LHNSYIEETDLSGNLLRLRGSNQPLPRLNSYSSNISKLMNRDPVSNRFEINNRPRRLVLPFWISLWLILAFSFSPTWSEAAEAHDFSKWEKEIKAFEEMDMTNPPPKNAILFVGSSTIRMWKSLPQDYPNKKIINRGFGGSEIIDSTHFADRIIYPYTPDKIFLRAGGNDINAGKSPEQVFVDFRNFVESVKARLPETKIYFIGWSPSIARWKQADKEKTLNELVKDYAKTRRDVVYIDTYEMVLGTDGKPRAELFLPDKLHFNREGYLLLAEKVRPFL